jgi:hypothetical protein
VTGHEAAEADEAEMLAALARDLKRIRDQLDQLAEVVQAFAEAKYGKGGTVHAFRPREGK